MTLVRPARSADADAVRETLAGAIEAFGPDAYDEREVAAWLPDDADPVLDGLDEAAQVVVVAEREGAVAGVGRLDANDGEVIAVYVHPDHARRGVGSTLLAHLEGHARAADLSELTLVASLNAVDFYERTGYERVGAVSHETSDGVELDCVEMRKEL
mgnify:FL=1